MRKMITIVAVIALLIAFAVPVLASGEVIVKVGKGSGCYSGEKSVAICLNFPLGFPSWKEEVSGRIFQDPTLVLIDKIADVKLERIFRDSSGGHLELFPASFGRSKGHFIIKGKVCAMSGEFVQILVTTWGGQKYELAIDKPWLKPGVNDMITVRGGRIEQLWDGTWGIRIN